MEYFRDRFIAELNDEGEIEIAGNVWSRHDVLETMDPDAATEVFQDWVDNAKQAAIERTREFLAETDCLDRFRTLAHRTRQGAVVPFVGAGMSATSGFPLWPSFLRSLARNMPALEATVAAHLATGAFEEAAQAIIDVRGKIALTEDIHNRFGSHRRELQGPVQLLPGIFTGEVVTTNFDYVLSQAYQVAGKAFTTVFCGPELRNAPQRIGNDPRCLLRLHGQGDDDLGRVLTLAEYEAAYTADRTLGGVLSAIIGLRSLLFVGCSLDQDRTLKALTQLRQASQVTPPRHYAFLQLPEPGQREERTRLLSAAEIYPIYYPAGDHDQYIEDMLITLMEGGL